MVGIFFLWKEMTFLLQCLLWPRDGGIDPLNRLVLKLGRSNIVFIISIASLSLPFFSLFLSVCLSLCSPCTTRWWRRPTPPRSTATPAWATRRRCWCRVSTRASTCSASCPPSSCWSSRPTSSTWRRCPWWPTWSWQPAWSSSTSTHSWWVCEFVCVCAFSSSLLRQSFVSKCFSLFFFLMSRFWSECLLIAEDNIHKRYFEECL